MSDTGMEQPCTKRADVGDVGSGPAMQARTRRCGKIPAPLRGPLRCFQSWRLGLEHPFEFIAPDSDDQSSCCRLQLSGSQRLGMLPAATRAAASGLATMSQKRDYINIINRKSGTIRPAQGSASYHEPSQPGSPTRIVTALRIHGIRAAEAACILRLFPSSSSSLQPFASSSRSSGSSGSLMIAVTTRPRRASAPASPARPGWPLAGRRGPPSPSP